LPELRHLEAHVDDDQELAALVSALHAPCLSLLWVDRLPLSALRDACPEAIVAPVARLVADDDAPPRLRVLHLRDADALPAQLAVRLHGLGLDLSTSLEALPRLPELRRLDVTIPSLAGVGALPLTHLGLGYFADLDPGPLADHPTVEVLFAGSALLPVVGRLPRLHTLALHGPIPPETVTEIPALTGLRTLHVHARVFDASALPALPSLEELVIHGCDTLHAADALLRLPALRRVGFSTARPDPATATRLRERGVQLRTAVTLWPALLHPDLW
jgi:hypothetical protein